jgi:hypothetical protein
VTLRNGWSVLYSRPRRVFRSALPGQDLCSAPYSPPPKEIISEVKWAHCEANQSHSFYTLLRIRDTLAREPLCTYVLWSSGRLTQNCLNSNKTINNKTTTIKSIYRNYQMQNVNAVVYYWNVLCLFIYEAGVDRSRLFTAFIYWPIVPALEERWWWLRSN